MVAHRACRYDREHEVRGAAGCDGDEELCAAMRGRQANLVAMDIDLGDPRIAEERAGVMPDVAELDLVADRAEGAIAFLGIPDLGASGAAGCYGGPGRCGGGSRGGQGGCGQQDGRAGQAGPGSEPPTGA